MSCSARRAPKTFDKRVFGRTGLTTGPFGLASSYGIAGADVERAFERGIDLFFFGSRRRAGFAQGVRQIAKQNRERMTIAVQSFTRMAFLMPWSLDRALKALGTDYVDLLCLGWWDGLPPQRILDKALELRARGKVKHLMISCHDRPKFAHLVATGVFDAIMVRYNAAHPGAEREVFPYVCDLDPGVLSFTATRWGTLVDPAKTPAGEKTPSAADCYRFVLSNGHVHATLTGPRDGRELDAGLKALELGPMDEAELAWMRRVGAHVRDVTTVNSFFHPIGARFAALCTQSAAQPKQLHAPR
jgi:aryl-alcohol dehydrogenase-like predicted oxidoreductase